MHGSKFLSTWCADKLESANNSRNMPFILRVVSIVAYCRRDFQSSRAFAAVTLCLRSQPIRRSAQEAWCYKQKHGNTWTPRITKTCPLNLACNRKKTWKILKKYWFQRLPCKHRSTTHLMTIFVTLYGKISTSARLHCGSSQQRWDEKWDDTSLGCQLGIPNGRCWENIIAAVRKNSRGVQSSVMEPHHIRKTLNIMKNLKTIQIRHIAARMIKVDPRMFLFGWHPQRGSLEIDLKPSDGGSAGAWHQNQHGNDPESTSMWPRSVNDCHAFIRGSKRSISSFC